MTLMPQRWTTFFAAVLVAATAVVGTAQQESIEELRARAEQGEASAQYNIGVRYDNGRGVPENDPEAVRWWRLAADQGDAGAQSNLGFMYANGRGVQRDIVQALMWTNLAALRGSSRAVTNREIYESSMTPAQVAEAQRLAREWNAAHPR